MSVMNRKMFNRNARNRLNTMGGIASFQLGGPVVANPNIFSTNPRSKYFQPNRSFIAGRQSGNNPTINLTGEQVKQIARNRLKRPKYPEGLASLFSPETATSPGGFIASSIGKGIATGADKTAQGVANLLNIFKPFSGMTPGVKKELEEGGGNIDLTGVDQTKIPRVTNIEGYEKFKRPIGMIPGKITKIIPEGSKGPKPFPETQDDLSFDTVPFDVKQSTDALAKQLDDEKAFVGKGTGDDKKDDKVKTKKDGTTIDDKVVPKPTTKEDVEKLITTGSQEEQQSELKQLMSEFKQNAPEYEGMDKNIALAKVFFSIAAGKDPDAITNIADGLNKGADMFLKDKKERDAFNRQVDLAALRYGLQERSKDRKLKYFIAGKDVTIDGKNYEKGSVVDLSEGFIRKNGIPSGLTTESLTKATLDNAAAIKKALAKAQKDKIISNKDFISLGKQVTDATDTFTKSRNLQTLIQGQIFQVADGNVTGLAPAAQNIVNKAANAVGIDMGTKYESLERYNADMRKVANQLIKDLLGEGSKNISNVDRQLAQEIVGLFTTGSGGLLGGYVFRDDDVLLSRLQGVHKTMERTQQKSLAQIENILVATQGQTFQSGAPVKFAEIANLGIAGPGARASAQGQGQKTIKLSEFFQGGKFDKDKLNKLLLG